MHEIPFPSEKTIEDYICSKIDEQSSCPVSGDYVEHFVRQHEIAGYGVTDIIKFRACTEFLHVTILELKNEPLKEAHLSQLSRYMAGLSRQLKRYGSRLGVKPIVKGELAGPFDIRGDFVYLADLIPNVAIFDLRLSIDDGFMSSQVGRGWHNKTENKKAIRPIIRDLWELGAFSPPMPPVANPKGYRGFD